MRDFKNRITKDPNWYTWVIGGLILLLGDIGLSRNIVASYYEPLIVITAISLILGPVFKEKWTL